MTKTTAPNLTPSPAASSKAQNKVVGKNTALSIFLSAVLDISWQMAIVVLVPIIGGYEIDKHIKTTPAFTVIGFILAMIGTGFVMKRALLVYSEKTVAAPKETK